MTEENLNLEKGGIFREPEWVVPFRIGILSDTHGMMRGEVLATLAGVDHILHAGDVGDISVLQRLREVAPVTAIRGNIDSRGDVAKLPATEVVELAGKTFYLLHDAKQIDLDPRGAGFAAVVSGHTHEAWIESRNGVFYINPGSCGPTRLTRQLSVAFAEIMGDKLTTEIAGLPW